MCQQQLEKCGQVDLETGELDQSDRPRPYLPLLPAMWPGLHI